MKKIKSVLILQFLFLFTAPLAFGQINVSLPENNYYNLGGVIRPEVSIKLDQDYIGFFKMHILCGEYDLQYYTIPLDLEANFRTQLSVPDLTLAGLMTGNCRLRADYDNAEDKRIDSIWSKYFVVESSLTIKVDDNIESQPGEDIIILGEIMTYNEELFAQGESLIIIGQDEYIGEITSGKLKQTIHLSEDIEIGDIPIHITISDKYGNYGTKTLNLRILPIPTSIENSLEGDVLIPGNKFKARINLNDKSGNTIRGTILNVKIINPIGEIIVDKEIPSTGYIEFEILRSLVPGDYSILSTFEDIKKQTSFTIEILRKIKMTQGENYVYIENIGNVDYIDEITIVLDNNDKEYLINEKIDLKPEEKISIDLSKEVTQDIYDITLLVNDDEPGNIIQDVLIEDNRNVVKKSVDSMSAVTGAIAGAAGYVASKPFLASIILILIILGTITHYSWGFIKKRPKGKGKDTENLFNDFKYEEKDEDYKFGN